MPTSSHVCPVCLGEHQQLTLSSKDSALLKGQNCESSGIGLFEFSGRGFYYIKPIFISPDVCRKPAVTSLVTKVFQHNTDKMRRRSGQSLGYPEFGPLTFLKTSRTALTTHVIIKRRFPAEQPRSGKDHCQKQ